MLFPFDDLWRMYHKMDLSAIVGGGKYKVEDWALKSTWNITPPFTPSNRDDDPLPFRYPAFVQPASGYADQCKAFRH